MTFDDAFERLLGHEGGYVNHGSDPGGATNFGISQRAYPNEDIRGMTADRAKIIYYADYWRPAGCDSVPESIRFDLFDMAVNAGVGTAVRCLQRAVGATADGKIGPRTLAALAALPEASIRARFNGSRLAALTELPTWPAFGKGWSRRIAANLMEV
jgi:lysozyme family protein